MINTSEKTETLERPIRPQENRLESEFMASVGPAPAVCIVTTHRQTDRQTDRRTETDRDCNQCRN